MRKRLVLFVIAFAISAGVGFWFVWQRPVSVTTAAVERGSAVELVYATGYVEPEHPVIVSSRATAPVAAVLVNEGDPVARGQPLVQLDDSEQHALLAQAAADAQGKTLAERRVTTLYAEGWVTRAARDEAVAAAKAARASSSALSARLDQMTVRAGISGVVLKREVEPGDLATPGKELLQLGDPASARITATVDERDIIRVHVGQVALLSADAFPGKVIRGRVYEITPGGDPTQRAFRVRIHVEDAISLPFGLTLEVNIVVNEHQKALLVPTGAVIAGRVWLVRDHRVQRRMVRTGITGTDKAEIASGLQAGDIVVVNPSAGLREGDRVRP